MTARPAFVLAALALASQADAYVYLGNPDLVVSATRQPNDVTTETVHLDFVRMHKCGGGYVDYTVNQDVNFALGFHKTIGAGDWCGVSLRYSSAMTISNGLWTATYSEPYTAFTLDGGEEVYQALTPFAVTTGVFAGGAPGLAVTIN